MLLLRGVLLLTCAWSAHPLLSAPRMVLRGGSAISPRAPLSPLRVGSTSEDMLRERISRENEGDVGDAVIGDEKSASAAAELAFAGRPWAQIVVERLADALDEVREDLNGLVEGITHDPEMDGPLPLPTPKSERERIVVLGTGWASYAFLKTIDASRYDVVVVSPRNYFLFTPMLAGAAVGTVEYRSITEPIRKVNEQADYLEATVTEIKHAEKKVVCQSVVCEGMACDIEDFELSYDKLIVGVGAQTNTFGIKGVRENCAFLKQIEDASRVRRAVGNCFERANIPSLTEEQRRQALTFVTIGAGPTGVEFTSELRDFLAQDAPRYYPHLIKDVRVVLIEATSRILSAFDEDMAAAAMNALQQSSNERVPTEVILSKGVSEVKEREIVLGDGTTIPYGVAVWAAGNGPLPVVLDCIESIPLQKERQDSGDVPRGGRGRLLIDGWMRVRGAEGMFALGDCAVMDESLPPTAQVASQQASFLGRLLSGDYDVEGDIPRVTGERVRASDKVFPRHVGAEEDSVAKPFQYLDLGILAFVGNNKAIAQLKADDLKVKGKGSIGWLLWRGIYFSKQVSWRNRLLIALDWLRTAMLGRDISRLS